MVGVGRGAENNLLIKDAEALELGYRVDTVVLDKTGTITVGRPVVTDSYWPDNAREDAGKSVLLALERRSEHPLAEAVVTHLQDDAVSPAPLADFNSLTGRGVVATDANGTVYCVGNRKLLSERGIQLSDALDQQAARWQRAAKTVVFFANDREALGGLAIADQVKKSSPAAVRALQQRGITVRMLTGDNLETAAAVARQVGVKHFQAEMLPTDKADVVRKLQAEGRTVAMVGDGINDSEALALADLSIAMGQGSDIAMDVAKITLISSDLRSIPKALNLSRKTVRTIRQNLFWAFIYNLIGIPVAAGVLYPLNGFLLDPMIAGAAMAFSSVSVVLNSLRLRTTKI
jgi:Cu2+-exporting ATPase